MSKPTIFISYSRKDDEWKERLASHLGVAEKQGQLNQWFDTRIGAGEDWEPQIEAAMDAASIAVLLVTADYLNSEYVLNKEIPRFLERRASDGLRVIPVLVKPCDWEAVDWLRRIQMRPDPKRPISAGNEYSIDADFAAIAKEIRELLKRTAPPVERTFVPLNPDEISIACLPDMLTNDLFGREAELKLLDDAWVQGKTNIVCLVAFGGSGKSALVNRWLQEMAREAYRGAARVYAWSFLSQGSDQPQTSADPFIDAALRWFGDPDSQVGSPWDKGERLARLIKQTRTLLILDGLEPLQHPRLPLEGRLKEQSMQALLKELAGSQPGLCVISTREQIANLKGFVAPAVIAHDLDQLSPEAGANILRQQNIKGSDEELQQASKDFGGHALALTILASFLHNAYDGDIRRRQEIAPLTDDELNGGHARRVMSSYETWLRDADEHTLLAVLRLLGLFNRPADAAALAALRAAPAIPELTEALLPLSEPQWKQTLAKLRRLKLLTEHPASASSPTNDEVDAHPLLREHFRDQLQRAHPAAWMAGNLRLYEHLTRITPTAKEFPDTLEEMQPLFSAVTHGCAAGRHQEALCEVYLRRIQRGDMHFNWNNLSAFGADLAALRSFFEIPWHQPVRELTKHHQGFVLHEAGFDLRALGRLSEAVKAIKLAMELAISIERWGDAGTSAFTISEISLALGDLHQALSVAQQSLDLTDKSGDSVRRITSRAKMGDALHQVGKLLEAEICFQEAETMEKDFDPDHQILYSTRGFYYCDLLLQLGKYQDVQIRAKQTLEWAKHVGDLLSIGLDNLSLGRAYLLQAQTEDCSVAAQAADFLKRAVDGLKQAETQHHLPRGLLARAEWARIAGQFGQAERDLAEARSIAERGEMRLYQADCHLESARLALATGDRASARKAWETANAMIEEMGYHRRDGEVKEIEEQLR